jgi:tetratricopeptide (TPR) repeat protein
MNLHCPRAFALALVLLAAWSVALPSPLSADDGPRLIDMEPFDRLTVKQDEARQIDPLKLELKLRPIEMKKRRPLTGEDPAAKLRVRLFDRPTPQYEIAWKDIAKVELFEELVLDEAAALILVGNFDRAYENYRFLERRDPQFPGLAEAFAQGLFVEAAYWQAQQESEQALALLNEVHRRRPETEGLQAAISAVVDGLAARHIAAGRFAAVRGLVRDLATKFSDDPVVKTRVDEIKSLAAAEVAAARQSLDAGELRAAHERVSRAMSILPEAEGAKALRETIQARYRVFVVGVTSLGDAAGDTAADRDWTSLRQRRLTNRLLAERVAAGAQGSRFDSPFGQWTVAEDRLSLALFDGPRWLPDGPPVGAGDVARLVAALADPASRLYRPGLDEILTGIRVVDPRHVELGLRAPRADLNNFLQAPLVPWIPSASATGTGPFQSSARTDAEAAFRAIPEYFARLPDSASELVERRFGTGAAALAALVNGDVDVVDRVPPWEFTRFSRNKSLAIEPYAVPTVHLLAPNPRSARLLSPLARRAIAHGIDRQRIVDDVLGVAGAADRGRVLAGPFPAGFGHDDALVAWAYDPRRFLVLWDAAGATAGPNPAAPLVLVHPPDEVATRACRAIADQLQLDGRGQAVEVRALPDGRVPPTDGDWDLAYVQWPLIEPVVDARRLIGSAGLSGSASPWLEDALRRLSAATTATEVAERLREVERMAHADLPVIPLWQLTEHLAARQGLAGVGQRPVTLYQHVEQWRYENR